MERMDNRILELYLDCEKEMRKHARSLVRVLEQQFGKQSVFYGAEVGVWKGELTADLLRFFPEVQIMMVDSWEPFDSSAMHSKDNNTKAMSEAQEAAIQNTLFADKRRAITNYPSVRAARFQEDGSMDFVFIDADHYYESVQADLEAWWPKVQDFGIMAGHDYNGMGDRRKGWGIKRAVDEFFGAMDLEVRVEPGLVWWVAKGNRREGLEEDHA